MGIIQVTREGIRNLASFYGATSFSETGKDITLYRQSVNFLEEKTSFMNFFHEESQPGVYQSIIDRWEFTEYPQSGTAPVERL